MPQVHLEEQLFQEATRRAADGGYSSVEAYITHVVVHDLKGARDETPNLDHLFTPALAAELKEVSEKARLGGKTYTSDEVREHFRNKSAAWTEDHSG